MNFYPTYKIVYIIHLHSAVKKNITQFRLFSEMGKLFPRTDNVVRDPYSQLQRRLMRDSNWIKQWLND